MTDPCHGTASLAGTASAWPFWLIAAAVVLQSFAPAAKAAPPEPASGVFRVYVGTYTSGGGAEKSRGIYLLELDLRSGKLGRAALAVRSD